jgi:hypothetical protein
MATIRPSHVSGQMTAIKRRAISTGEAKTVSAGNPRSGVQNGSQGCGAMGPYLFFNGTFDPQATHAMGEAFELVCKDMRGGGQPAAVKEIVATRILQAAQSGERDPHRLAAQVMETIGIQASNRHRG